MKRQPTPKEALRQALESYSPGLGNSDNVDILDGLARSLLAEVRPLDILTTASRLKEHATDREPLRQALIVNIKLPDRMLLKQAKLTAGQFVLQNFSTVDLSEAKLVESVFVGCKFRGTICERTDFSRASLPDHDFVGSVLDNAIFHRAQLQGCKLSRVRGRELNGVSFDGAVLTGVDLHGVTVRNASFARASARSSNVRGTTFAGCDLTGVVLAGSNADDVLLDRCGLDFADFSWVTLRRARFEGGVERRLVRSLRLDEANMRPAHFANLDMIGCTFIHCDLRTARFENCRLVACDFEAAEVGPNTIGAGSVVLQPLIRNTEGARFLGDDQNM